MNLMKPSLRASSVVCSARRLAVPRLAGQHGADLDALEPGVLDLGDLVLVDLLVRLDDDAVRERIADVLERDAAEDAVADALDHLAALDQRGHLDAVERAAVVLG